MTTVRRYICWQMVYGNLLVLGVLLSLFTLFELIHQLSKVDSNQGIMVALYLTALEIPVDFLEVLPMSIAGGSAMSLGAMATQSELSAILTLGYSRPAILRSVLWSSGAFIVCMLVFNDILTPLAQEQAITFAQKQKVNTALVQSNLWVREEDRFIHIGYVLNGLYHDVTIYEYDDTHTQFKTITSAKVMKIDNTQLSLSDVQVTQLEQNQIHLTTVENKLLKWSTGIENDTFQIPAAATLNSIQLFQQIAALKKNSLDYRLHEIELWQRISNPLSILVLLLVVVPLCCTIRYKISAWFYMLLGISIGLLYLIMNRIVIAWGLLHHYPSFAMVFTMPILFAMAGLWFNRTR